MAEIDDPFMTLESDNSATATLDRPFEPLEEEDLFATLHDKPPLRPLQFTNIQAARPGQKEIIYLPETQRRYEVPVGSFAVLNDMHKDGAYDDISEPPSSAFDEFKANIEQQSVFMGLIAFTSGMIDVEKATDWISERSRASVNASRHAPEYYTKAQQEYSNAKGFWEHAAVVANNPKWLGRMAFVQAPNSIAPLMASLVGSAAGPAGTFGGLFFGDVLVEMGAWMDQEIQKTGIDMSDPKQLMAVLMDENFMSDIRNEALRKGLATGAIDTLTAIFGGRLLRKLIPNPNAFGKIVRTTGGVAVESVGEGVGEVTGQLAATLDPEKVDIAEGFLEAISSLSQSVGTVVLTQGIGKKVKAEGQVTPVQEEGVVTNTERLQGAVDDIQAEEGLADEEQIGEVKPESITPEIVAETVKNIENIVKEIQAEEIIKAEAAGDATQPVPRETITEAKTLEKFRKAKPLGSNLSLKDKLVAEARRNGVSEENIQKLIDDLPPIKADVLDVVTGEPVSIDVVRGIGRAKGKEVAFEGINVLGEGRYSAIDEEVAKVFGPKIEKLTVKLKNPYVIDSDVQLSKLFGENIPFDNKSRLPLLKKLRADLEAQGYDSVIVNVPIMADVNFKGQSIKRIREIFGDTQVVEFKPKTVPRETGEQIEKVLEVFGPSQATRETLIKGRIKKLESDMRAKTDQIVAMDKLRDKVAKPSKSLNNQIDTLENELAILEADLDNMLILGLANDLKVVKKTSASQRKFDKKQASKENIKAEAESIFKELNEGQQGEIIVPKLDLDVSANDQQQAFGVKSTNPAYLFGDLDRVGLKQQGKKPNTRNKRTVMNMVQRIIDNPDINPKAFSDPAQQALVQRILDLINDRLKGEQPRFVPGTGFAEEFVRGFVETEETISENEKLQALFESLENKEAIRKAEIDTSQTIEIKGEKLVSLETQSLKAQEQALNRGLREGARTTTKNIKQVSKNIRDLVNASSLEADDKKAILALAQFDNKENFLKILPKLRETIQASFNRTQRRELIESIKDAMKKVGKARNIAVDVVRQIEDLVKDIDLVKRTEKTKNRLQNTLDFIKRQIEAGKDIEIPKRVITELELLNKIPIEKLTNEDLQALLNQINALKEVGKRKFEIRKEIKELTKEERLKLITEDARPLEERPIKTREDEVGGQLERMDKFKNKFNRAANIVKRKLIALSPMDVVFDMMSKVGNYKGAISTIFKRTLDIANSKYIDQVAGSKRRILDTVKTLGLKEQGELGRFTYNRIATWAALQQEGGREHLLSSYTEKALAKFEKEGLTNKEEALLKVIREEFEKLKPLVKQVLKVVYNKDLTDVSDYFPMQTDFKAMEGWELQNMFGRDVQLIGSELFTGGLTINVEKGFTEERFGGKNPIKLDALEIAMKHIDNASYLIHMAQDIKELGELANTDEFRKAAGKLGQEITRNWIDLMARHGGKEGHRSNVFDVLRKNTGWAVLGYKLSSALIQPTALLDGAALIGRYAFKGAYNVLLNPEWRAFMMDNFSELKSRIGDDVAYAALMQGVKKETILGKAKIGSFWLIRTLDGVTATAIAAGAYEKIVTEKGGLVDFAKPDLDAIQDATLIMRRTQSSGLFKDAPSALTRGTFIGSVSADKLIFQFQSFMLTRWSLIQHDMIHNGIRLGQTQQSLNIATYLILAAMAEVGIRRGAEEIIAAATGSGDDLEDIDEDLLNKFLMELFRTIPVFGSIMNSFNYGNIPVPVISITERALDSLKLTIKTKDDERKFKHAARSSSSGW